MQALAAEHHQGGDQSTAPFLDDGSLFRSS